MSVRGHLSQQRLERGDGTGDRLYGPTRCLAPGLCSPEAVENQPRAYSTYTLIHQTRLGREIYIFRGNWYTLRD